MFSEVGIRDSLIQNRRDDEAFVNTAWTFQLVRGFVMAAVVAALAWPMAQFYGEPTLTWLIVAVGCGSIIAGAESTSMVTLNRQMREKPRAILSMASALIRRGGMIGVALVWPTAWALVIGSLIGGLFQTAMTHTALPGIRNRLRWDPQAVRQLLSFGKWIFVGTIIAFFGREIDKLMLGKLFEQGEAIGLVGVYAIAQRIAGMPAEATTLLGGNMAFPAMSEIARTDRPRFEERALKIRGMLLQMALVFCLLVMFAAPWFFRTLYDDRYAAAQWMAPLIVVGAWIGLLDVLVNKAMLALGKPRPLTISGAVFVVGRVAGALAGFYLAGVPGFILGMMAGGVIKHVMNLTMLARRGVRLYQQSIAFTLAFALLAGAGSLAVHESMTMPSITGRVLLGVGVPLMIVGSAAYWAGRRVLPEVLKR